MVSLKTKNWALDNIETILFDKDGTFIDLHFFWGKMTEMRVEEIIERFNLSESCFSELCFSLGYDINSKKMLSNGITALYSRSKIIEIFRKDLQIFNLEISVQELESIFDEVSQKFYENINLYTKPIDSAISFIKELYSKGVKLGVVTSDSLESTKLTLKSFEWEDLFLSVIGRESSKFTKESGIPTKMALQELNAKPETTIMIGDAPMDYISAKNAGLKACILVASGQLDSEELSKTNEYVIESLSEIVVE